ncbi:hypothetical protein GUJ93_ZPchr0002g25231 [Zizania palustris]|uniref:Uncharacterized protein n=1 Tax=Zizania palustris TaxID=103762 RepID=A0A8J5SGL8_ZIZPA|nr:hypothetical protein GUJ93_ZPchr0002g25231 [Zizania palustris]
MHDKVLNGRTLSASIAEDNGRASEFIRRRVNRDKSRCYERGGGGPPILRNNHSGRGLTQIFAEANIYLVPDKTIEHHVIMSAIYLSLESKLRQWSIYLMYDTEEECKILYHSGFKRKHAEELKALLLLFSDKRGGKKTFLLVT